MHQPNHGANSSAAAVTRTRRLSQPYIPSTVHHSSSPGSVIYAGTTFAARRSGAVTEFWQPTAFSAANNGEKDAANRKGNRVQLHALYLILCVVLFNMVALLSIVHFKLLLVVSPDGISGTNSSDFVAPSPLLKARHREGKRRVAVANADGREKSLLLSSFEQLAANTKGIGRRKPQFQHQTVETNIANGSSHDDLRQLRKSGSHQDKREDGGDNADNKTKIGTGILRQTPLAKVGYRLSKAPAEQETSETTEPYTADMPSHSQQLMRAFPACSGCLQPIVPASQLEGQQLLVDCRTEMHRAVRNVSAGARPDSARATRPPGGCSAGGNAFAPAMNAASELQQQNGGMQTIGMDPAHFHHDGHPSFRIKSPILLIYSPSQPMIIVRIAPAAQHIHRMHNGRGNSRMAAAGRATANNPSPFIPLWLTGRPPGRLTPSTGEFLISPHPNLMSPLGHGVNLLMGLFAALPAAGNFSSAGRSLLTVLLRSKSAHSRLFPPSVRPFSSSPSFHGRQVQIFARAMAGRGPPFPLKDLLRRPAAMEEICQTNGPTIARGSSSSIA